MRRPHRLTVGLMSDTTRRRSCFLAEWYYAEPSDETIDRGFAQLTRGAELMSENGASAKVLLLLSVPTDDVIFCVFAASSSEVVAQACNRAGIPAERVTAAVATPFS